MTRMDTDNS